MNSLIILLYIKFIFKFKDLVKDCSLFFYGIRIIAGTHNTKFRHVSPLIMLIMAWQSFKIIFSTFTFITLVIYIPWFVRLSQTYLTMRKMATILDKQTWLVVRCFEDHDRRIYYRAPMRVLCCLLMERLRNILHWVHAYNLWREKEECKISSIIISIKWKLG